MGDKIAVIIAVERYRDARIQTVDYAEADAKDFGDVLELHGYKIQKLLIDVVLRSPARFIIRMLALICADNLAMNLSS